MAIVDRDILKKYEEREKQRLEYEQNRIKRVDLKADKKAVFDKEDKLNLPRHRVLPKFPHMQECPLCFRMRGYNLSIVSEGNYVREHPDDFCMKPHIHNEETFVMMISRERINLDEKNE